MAGLGPKALNSSVVESLSKRLLNNVELNIACFGFLLNFTWEIFQAPLFQDMSSKAHRDAVLQCTKATGGDLIILLFAFWTTALIFRDHRWLAKTHCRPVVVFAVLAFMAATGTEILMTRYLHHYSYGPAMPIVLLLKIGLAPFLQWIILPPLALWFVRRQTRSTE
jgi:hypothetical protein